MRWVEQPRIRSFKKLWSKSGLKSKFKALEFLANGSPQIIFFFKIKRTQPDGSVKTYQWEWAYNLLIEEAKQKWGVRGYWSLRNPVTWWRQITHFLGGFVLGLVLVCLPLSFFADRNFYYLLASVPGVIHSVIKERKDSKHYENWKNTLDIAFWFLGGLSAGLIFILANPMPF